MASAQGATVAVAGLSVGAVAVAAGVAGCMAQILEEVGGAVFAELGDGGSVGALFGPVEVVQAGYGAVPAQQLEEQRLPYLVGCLPDAVGQLVHARHCRCRIRHLPQSVQAAGGDESGDEVGDAGGFVVGEVKLFAGDQGAGWSEWVESVENSG